jgi:hypothetical protein
MDSQLNMSGMTGKVEADKSSLIPFVLKGEGHWGQDGGGMADFGNSLLRDSIRSMMNRFPVEKERPSGKTGFLLLAPLKSQKKTGYRIAPDRFRHYGIPLRRALHLVN